VSLTTATSVGDGFFGAIGVGVVTAAAAAAGVASIPTPLTEAGWDGWMLHRYFALEAALGAGSDGEFVNLQLDSKAMRKLTEDDSLAMVAEVAENGTATATLQARIRVLSMTG